MTQGEGLHAALATTIVYVRRMDLPKQWLSPGSNPELWGMGSTYKAIPYEALPLVDGPFDGSFAWLTKAPQAWSGMSFERRNDEPIAEHLWARVEEATRAGLTIPEAFVKFMVNPALHTRVPSCTACYYDLGAHLVPVSAHPGPERLLRFMNDQQACCLWYLLLEPGGGHEVAYAWPRWKDDDDCGDILEDAADPCDVTVCASSFEEFIKRFWIENTLWYAASRGQTFEGELLAYARAARRAVVEGLVPERPELSFDA